MPAELLIHATTHRKAKKGMIQTVFDSPATWGNREGLPDYVILTISDATKAQVDQYTQNWENDLTYEVLASNAQGRRYKVSVNAKMLAAFPTKGLKAEMKDLFISDYNAVLVEWEPAQLYVILDIPNTDWAALKRNFLDLFEEQVDIRKFLFSPADVDLAVAAGGKVILTKAQAINRITDRSI